MKSLFGNKYIVLSLTLVILATGAYLYINNPDPIKYDGGQVACTMDAMLCPDGSYVGRSGPNCEFKCPEINSCENGFCEPQNNIETESATTNQNGEYRNQ